MMEPPLLPTCCFSVVRYRLKPMTAPLCSVGFWVMLRVDYQGPRATCALMSPQVVDHKLYGSRSEFDSTIDRVLEEFAVEIVCLAGFMRILTGAFVRKWNGTAPWAGST